MRYSYLFVSCVIWLTACVSSKQSNRAATASSEELFVGNSVTKLRGYKSQDFPSAAWVVEDGALKAKTGVSNVDLLTKERYKDFDLTFEWKTSVGGNSGVFFHVQEDSRAEAGNGNSPNWLNNFEMQLLDDVGFNDKEPKRSAGALYDLIAPTNKVLRPVGEYNTARLLVQNDRVVHWINGRKVLEYRMNSPEMKALIQQSKFRDIAGFGNYTEGHIMFQHHGQEVWLRNIRIRRL